MTPYPFPARDFQSKAGISADGVVGQNTWRYLLGSDADTSVGKNYGGGSSSSSSSGGGSGGVSKKGTAQDMAEFARSKVGMNKSELGLDDRGNWCDDFVEYCAKAVGYMTNDLSQLTNSTRGIRPYQSSSILTGYSAFINDKIVSHGHWGIIYSKSSTAITIIEGNTPDYNLKPNYKVNMVYYFWDDYTDYYQRSDGYKYHVHRYLRNP